MSRRPVGGRWSMPAKVTKLHTLRAVLRSCCAGTGVDLRHRARGFDFDAPCSNMCPHRARAHWRERAPRGRPDSLRRCFGAFQYVPPINPPLARRRGRRGGQAAHYTVWAHEPREMVKSAARSLTLFRPLATRAYVMWSRTAQRVAGEFDRSMMIHAAGMQQVRERAPAGGRLGG